MCHITGTMATAAFEGGMEMENENKIDLIVWLQRSLDVVSKTWKVLLVSLLLFTVLNVVHEVINYQPLYES